MSNVKKLSGIAISAMVIGICALVFSWMPIINNISGIASMVGFVLSIPALIITCKKKTKRGKGFAIAGFVTNVVAFAIMWYTQTAYAFILSQQISVKKKIFGIIAAILIVLFGFCMCSSEPVDLNPYNVKVTKETVTSDQGGDKVLIVNYEWTNSDPSPMTLESVYNIKAYQNGVELNEEFLIDGNWDFDSWYNEVKPGSTQTFQRAYDLTNQSNVTIELYDMWSSDPVISKTISIK